MREGSIDRLPPVAAPTGLNPQPGCAPWPTAQRRLLQVEAFSFGAAPFSKWGSLFCCISAAIPIFSRWIFKDGTTSLNKRNCVIQWSGPRSQTRQQNLTGNQYYFQKLWPGRCAPVAVLAEWARPPRLASFPRMLGISTPGRVSDVSQCLLMENQNAFNIRKFRFLLQAGPIA